MRFWDVDRGRVALSGTDVRVVDTSALRDAEAFVEQDTHLFHDSIRDNLLIARPEATDVELETACRAASVHDFICSLPNGYDTMAGELGDTLSGGERRRLGLARALGRGPHQPPPSHHGIADKAYSMDQGRVSCDRAPDEKPRRGAFLAVTLSVCCRGSP